MLTRMGAKHPTRPGAAKHVNEDLTSRMWTTDQMLAMHDAFTAAMCAAGYEITEPSSRPGTRAPILGYRRQDV